MGFMKAAAPRTPVEVVKSTHGNTFVTWPSSVTQKEDLPALPVGHSHSRSRHWVLANKTAILILPGDGEGGVVRHTYDVVQSAWNSKKKTLTSQVVHPSDPEVVFMITTSGVGCSCTQGPAGNAGPIGEPYQIVMVNSNAPEFDWYTVVP